MGRRLRANIPFLDEQLHVIPDWKNLAEFQRKNQNFKRQTKARLRSTSWHSFTNPNSR